METNESIDSTESAATSTPRRPTQLCKNCKNEIPLGAKLCSECKSYQNWIGGLNNSSLVLSLLVALVSVLSTAVPVIKSALRPMRSEVSLQRYYFTENGVSLVLLNPGRMPGYVSSCKMNLLNGTSFLLDFNFNLDNPSDTRIVKADSIVEIFFKTDHKWMTTFLQGNVPSWQVLLNDGQLKAQLIVDITQFSGTTDEHKSNLFPLKDFYFKY